MHTTHLLFLLSALASDYENSTRPSKKASGTTNRTNKKNNPSPSPFFAAKRPPQSPAEILTSWPWVFNSIGIFRFLSWRLHCFPCAQQVWGRGHWCGKSVFTRTYLCTIRTYAQPLMATFQQSIKESLKMSWLLTSTALVEVSTPTFLLLEPKQRVALVQRN